MGIFVPDKSAAVSGAEVTTEVTSFD